MTPQAGRRIRADQGGSDSGKARNAVLVLVALVGQAAGAPKKEHAARPGLVLHGAHASTRVRYVAQVGACGAPHQQRVQEPEEPGGHESRGARTVCSNC